MINTEGVGMPAGIWIGRDVQIGIGVISYKQKLDVLCRIQYDKAMGRKN